MASSRPGLKRDAAASWSDHPDTLLGKRDRYSRPNARTFL